MKTSLIDALKDRRSYMQLKNESKLSKDEIIDLVTNAVKYTPTAFDSQTGCVVILFNDNHDLLWEITKKSLKEVAIADQFPKTEMKINTLKNSYGTILFFEDQAIIKDLQEKYPLYSDNFPKWSEQSHGMLALTVWLLLTENNMGANLQHYNPLIDNEVKEKFNIPTSWVLKGQMPFGVIDQDVKEKTFKNIDERIKVFK